MCGAKGHGVVAVEPNARAESVAGPPYEVRPIGWVPSTLTDRAAAPRQGDEGAPSAGIVLTQAYRAGLKDIQAGQDVLVLTCLHLARRDLLLVRPRGDESRPLTGVFATRAP